MSRTTKTGEWSKLIGLATVVSLLLSATSASAQQAPGATCSASATTTVDGKYVPSPPPEFGGTINLSATDSKPCWPPTVVPPKGAPNVLLIMTDDQGYGVTSTFGGGLERFRWEGKDVLAPGRHTIVFDFKYDGPCMAKGGTGVLSVDGKESARTTIPQTIPALVPVDETFDVGVDTRTGVDDNDYQPPFRFTGKLIKLTVNLKPASMSAEEHKLFDQEAKRVSLAAE
jgi:hypothetical protein